MNDQATKWQCEHAKWTSCSRGDGTPKRKKCAYCGGRIRVLHGLWGVFAWTGDGHYPLSNALATFTSRKRADAAADKGDNTVVRWIQP